MCLSVQVLNLLVDKRCTINRIHLHVALIECNITWSSVLLRFIRKMKNVESIYIYFDKPEILYVYLTS